MVTVSKHKSRGRKPVSAALPQRSLRSSGAVIDDDEFQALLVDSGLSRSKSKKTASSVGRRKAHFVLNGKSITPGTGDESDGDAESSTRVDGDDVSVQEQLAVLQAQMDSLRLTAAAAVRKTGSGKRSLGRRGKPTSPSSSDEEEGKYSSGRNSSSGRGDGNRGRFPGAHRPRRSSVLSGSSSSDEEEKFSSSKLRAARSKLSGDQASSFINPKVRFHGSVVAWWRHYDFNKNGCAKQAQIMSIIIDALLDPSPDIDAIIEFVARRLMGILQADGSGDFRMADMFLVGSSLWANDAEVIPADALAMFGKHHARVAALGGKHTAGDAAKKGSAGRDIRGQRKP